MENQCMLCEHSPHRKAPCTVCGCTQWVNSVVQIARGVTQVNNILVQEIPKLLGVAVDILELLMEAYPDAVAKIDSRREMARKKIQEEQDEKQTEEIES